MVPRLLSSLKDVDFIHDIIKLLNNARNLRSVIELNHSGQNHVHVVADGLTEHHQTGVEILPVGFDDVRENIIKLVQDFGHKVQPFGLPAEVVFPLLCHDEPPYPKRPLCITVALECYEPPVFCFLQIVKEPLRLAKSRGSTTVF